MFKELTKSPPLVLAVCILLTSHAHGEELQKGVEKFAEIGFLSAQSPQIISVGVVKRYEDMYLFSNLGIFSTLNIGIGANSNNDGSGFNARASAGPFLWSTSLTYKFKPSKEISLDMGVGYFRTWKYFTKCNGSEGWSPCDFYVDFFYPVISLRHTWN